MSTVSDFVNLVTQHGSDVVFHREDSAIPCPCRTKQGYRDPVWHIQHPLAPVCNPAGLLPAAGEIINIPMKAFVQPVQAGAVRRLTSEQLGQMFGELRSDDHIGFFPISWGGTELNFYDWGLATEDYILYMGRKFITVAVNMIPDPADGGKHHWEVGLRLVSD